MHAQRPRRRSLVALLAVYGLATAVVIAACGATPAPTPTAEATVAPAPATASPAPSATPSVAPSPSLGPSQEPSPTPPGPDPLLGTDGRFTILLLGSDYRPAHPGNRTDAIMLVSLDPSTGKVGVFSVPRDTAGFPMPGGGTFKNKVNGLYQYYQAKNGHGLASMERAISEAYQIEVDFGVLIGFKGVTDLIGAVGGVTVNMKTAYYDPVYWVTSKQQGWGLSAGTHHLDPANALIFARSRHGDNDFNRARRQQQLVAAAVTQVLGKGSDILPKLLNLAKSTITTDLPLLRALDLYALVKTADLKTVQGKVFGPRTFADEAGGTSFTPNLPVCRAWVAAHFPPARPGATWSPQG